MSSQFSPTTGCLLFVALFSRAAQVSNHGSGKRVDGQCAPSASLYVGDPWGWFDWVGKPRRRSSRLVCVSHVAVVRPVPGGWWHARGVKGIVAIKEAPFEQRRGKIDDPRSPMVEIRTFGFTLPLV